MGVAAEAGVPGVDVSGGLQFFGPRNMAPEVLAKVNAALAASLKITPRKLEALESDRFDELPDATFTRALALEGAFKGVTVNAIAPGYIDTDMVAAVPEDVLGKIVAKIPVKRLGKTPRRRADHHEILNIDAPCRMRPAAKNLDFRHRNRNRPVTRQIMPKRLFR